MKKLSIEELRSYQIGILDAVASYCEENKINYYLTGGTLLGAVRHKGYIPWDDDIDICMSRSDFEKFGEGFNGWNKRYKLYRREFGKVLDLKTVLYEPDENGSRLCVNIDLFINDNAPDSDMIVNSMYDRRDKLRKKIIRRQQSRYQRVTGFHSLWYYIRGVFMRMIPEKYYMYQLVRNAKRFEKIDSGYIGDFCGFYHGQPRVKVSKDLFSGVVPVEFEGKTYNAPIGYHAWLTALYGDYMTLPPEEERVSHHSFAAYRID